MLYDKSIILSELNNEEYKKMTPTEKLVYLNKLKQLLDEERDKVLNEVVDSTCDIIVNEKRNK